MSPAPEVAFTVDVTAVPVGPGADSTPVVDPDPTDTGPGATAERGAAEVMTVGLREPAPLALLEGEGRTPPEVDAAEGARGLLRRAWAAADED